MNKVLIFALIFGILLGTLTGIIASKLFPGMTPYFKKELPITTMILIFLLNSFLATLICYGGILFSLAEVRVYKFSIYRALDVVFDPLYNLLSKISEDMKRLKPMYRSCYLSISYFPIGCIFLFATIVATYFSVFLSRLGLSILLTILKFVPHLTLETLAFLFAASTGLKMSKKIVRYLFEEKIVEFGKKSRKFLRDRNMWRNLLIAYLILLFSAFVEKFFVEM